MTSTTRAVALAAALCSLAPAPAAPRPSIERLARLFSGLESLGFSGAVIVEHRGRVAHRAGYGPADRAAGLPYTPETVQTHGSITKQITAAAILLLESRGRLSVRDPLWKHLEGVPDDKRSITLHHLLTHSAGLPGGLGPDDEPIGSGELARRALAAPLEFEPGRGQAYSNVGYSLAGIVVERASGRPYEAFVRDELLRPAGLDATGYRVPIWDTEPTRLAIGYRDGERWGLVHRRGWRDDGPGWHLRANGGLHTTVDDMHRWLRVVQGDGPLPPEAVERWTTAHVLENPQDETSGYGYGWEVARTPYGPMIAHNGGNGVFSADFVWLPERELFVYVQGNSSVVPAAGLRELILGALFDRSLRLPPTVGVDPDATPRRATAHAGEYVFDGGTLRLAADDTRLVARVDGRSPIGDGSTFVLVPGAAGRWEAVLREPPWRRSTVREGVAGCLELGDAIACPPHRTQAAFHERLRALCGARFEGEAIGALDGSGSLRGARLVATFEQCGERSLAIPLAVDDDRSRVWRLSRRGSGLELSLGGGGARAVDGGSASSQRFAMPGSDAEAETWAIELSTDGSRLSVERTRDGAVRFRTVLRRVR